MGVLKKRDQIAAAGKGPVGVPKADSLAKKFPGLWEFLTVSAYPGGETRVPGTLTIFADGEFVKGCLSDRDQGLVAFASSVGLEGLFSVLEDGLQQDSLEWRAQQKAGPRKKS